MTDKKPENIGKLADDTVESVPEWSAPDFSALFGNSSASGGYQAKKLREIAKQHGVTAEPAEPVYTNPEKDQAYALRKYVAERGSDEQ